MMLRRLKEDVEKSLAPKEETIIEVELTAIQKKYYRYELNIDMFCIYVLWTNHNVFGFIEKYDVVTPLWKCW